MRNLYELCGSAVNEKKEKGKYHFVDPMFKQWLIKRYGDVQGLPTNL